MLASVVSVQITSARSSTVGPATTCAVDTPKGCFSEKRVKGWESGCPEKGGACSRCLGYYPGARFNGATSRENCACICHQHGFALAGVENGNNCYCDQPAAFPGKFCGPMASGCDVACDANRTQTCGGRLRMEVFSFSCPSACTVTPHPDPPSPPSPPPPLGPDCRPAMGMKCGLPHWTPAFHPAPPCYHKGCATNGLALANAACRILTGAMSLQWAPRHRCCSLSSSYENLAPDGRLLVQRWLAAYALA